MKFRTPLFDQLTALNLFTAEGHNYLFALLLGGTTYAIGLIFIVSSGACLINAFGYQVPYTGFRLSNMQNFGSFLSQMYYFYNRSIIEVLYPRLIRFYRKIRPPKFMFHRNVVLFSIITIGGVISNFTTDSVTSYYYLGGETLLIHAFKSIFYFLLFSTAVVIGSKNKINRLNIFFRIILYFTVISFIFSFRRLIFLQKDLDTFLHIFYKIITDFI